MWNVYLKQQPDGRTAVRWPGMHREFKDREAAEAWLRGGQFIPLRPGVPAWERPVYGLHPESEQDRGIPTSL